MSQTRSQAVARRAYELVAARERLAADARKKYLSFARAFPTLVHQCGVCQAVAFARAKGGEHEQVLDDVARVLAGSGYQFRAETAGADLDGHARATGTGVMRYLRLTREVLAAAGWVKRYAEAVLAEGDDAAGANPG